MPLSISNFSNSGWGKSWILGLILAIVLLGGLEYLWRVQGHKPSIVDDYCLWAIERSKVSRSNKELVLLGSSRMQTDISMRAIQRIIPDYNIINLSINGSCANAVLHDLALDESFKGTVIMETTSECLMFGNDRKISQQSHVDYFYKTYNLNNRINRQIATFLQHKLILIDPWLNLIKVFGNLIYKKEWRSPDYVITYENRLAAADYTKVDVSQSKAVRLKKTKKHYRELQPRISTQLLMQQLADIENDVRRIVHRGGKVVFIRFPVTGEHWEMDEHFFPRAVYWDTIIPKTSAHVLHFNDIKGIKFLKCPDTSHLDAMDREAFTTLLFNELINEIEL